MKTKQQQYNEYLNNKGSMTLAEWENDGRYDPSSENELRQALSIRWDKFKPHFDKRYSIDGNESVSLEEIVMTDQDLHETQIVKVINLKVGQSCFVEITKVERVK